MMKDTARGFSLFEEAWLILKAKDSNVEPHTKVAAAFQNTIQCYHVICNKKKRATTQTSLDCFFKRVNRTESSKEPEPVPSTWGVSEIAACLPSPIADNLQLYHLTPPFPSPLSNFSCLFTWCQSLYASCCTVRLYFSRYCKIKNVLFFMYYLCEKHYKPITVQHYTTDCVW